jgi:hypothetical protein
MADKPHSRLETIGEARSKPRVEPHAPARAARRGRFNFFVPRSGRREDAGSTVFHHFARYASSFPSRRRRTCFSISASEIMVQYFIMSSPASKRRSNSSALILSTFLFPRRTAGDEAIDSAAERERDVPDFALVVGDEAIAGFSWSAAGANVASLGIKPKLLRVDKA